MPLSVHELLPLLFELLLLILLLILKLAFSFWCCWAEFWFVDVCRGKFELFGEASLEFLRVDF